MTTTKTYQEMLAEIAHRRLEITTCYHCQCPKVERSTCDYCGEED